MLEIGKSNGVKFKVDVNGTAALPSVKFILEAPEAELGFTATKGDGYWFTSVALPEDFRPGNYDFRIEVLVNNRLFTPVKKRVEVIGPVSTPAVATPAVATPAVATPAVATPAVATPAQNPSLLKQFEGQTPAFVTQTKEQTRDWEAEGGALKRVKEIPKPLPPEKVPAAPTQAPRPSVPSPTPVKEAKKAKPSVRINIAEIVAESNRKFDKVLTESPTYKKPTKIAKPINILPQTPVTLKKGKVVYE